MHWKKNYETNSKYKEPVCYSLFCKKQLWNQQQIQRASVVTAYIVQNHFSKFSFICCRFLQKWESENNLKNISNEKLFQVASLKNHLGKQTQQLLLLFKITFIKIRNERAQNHRNFIIDTDWTKL